MGRNKKDWADEPLCPEHLVPNNPSRNCCLVPAEDYVSLQEKPALNIEAIRYRVEHTTFAYPVGSFDEWLKGHNAKIKARALRDAARDLNDPRKTTMDEFDNPVRWLRRRATQITKRATS